MMIKTEIKKALNRQLAIAKQKDEALSRRLAFARICLGLTQFEFARQLGISRETLISYENNRRVIPTDLALKACRHFILSEKWLATGSGRSRPCVDLMAEPFFLDLKDPSIPFSWAYRDEKMEQKYNDIEGLGFSGLMERLMEKGGNNSKRLYNLFSFFTNVLRNVWTQEAISEFIKQALRYCIEQSKKEGWRFDFDKVDMSEGGYFGVPLLCSNDLIKKKERGPKSVKSNLHRKHYKK